MFGVDWSEGWAGNITAELVGLVGGLAVTYFIADRIIRWRLNAERRPLRGRLTKALEANLRMLTISWALSLGLWQPGELASGDGELEERVESELERYQSPAGVEELAKLLNSDVRRRLPTLAKEILDDVQGVSRAADRFANVIADDPTLHGLIADLEECGVSLGRSLLGLPSLVEAGAGDAGNLALAAFCKAAHYRATKLHRSIVSLP